MIICSRYVASSHAYPIRAKVSYRIRQYAQSHGIVIKTKYILRSPHVCYTSVLRKWATSQLSPFMPIWPQWCTPVYARLSINVGVQLPWKKKLVNVQRLISNFDHDTIAGCPIEAQASAELGLDMLRIPVSLNIVANITSHESQPKIYASCTNWLSSIGILSHTPMV